MCLAIPAQVVLVDDNRMAQVDTHGVVRTVSLDLVPAAEVGSWVLVHAGYAIEVVDEQFANESWDLIKQLIEAGDEYTITVVGPLAGEDDKAVAGNTEPVA
jgi:hydrogenase expression/formation protein HypC